MVPNLYKNIQKKRAKRISLYAKSQYGRGKKIPEVYGRKIENKTSRNISRFSSPTLRL